MIAETPEPPYTAVIFTSVRNDDGDGGEGYGETAAEMHRLAAEQPGFLGVESARGGLGLTVSYWRTEEDARAWKRVAEHVEAQRRGRRDWYAAYEVRIATVTRAYGTRHER